MKYRFLFLMVCALLIGGILSGGCGNGGSSAPVAAPAKSTKAAETGKDEHDHDHDHDHDDDGDHGHGHAHAPLRGGVLVELGEETGHLEVVFDRASGKLSAYAMDGHMESPVRLKFPALSLTVRVGDAAGIQAELKAVANPLTGETLGDTSEFSAIIEALKGVDSFQGEFPAMEFRGVQVPAASFKFSSDLK